MRNEDAFSWLYKEIKESATKIEQISSATLPRKRKIPNYSILHYITGNPEAAVTAHYPDQNAKEIHERTKFKNTIRF